jgi:rod shape-determining protein MreD
MSALELILILGGAFLAVFWESFFGGVRTLLGAQIDLLPALTVYASLHGGAVGVALIAVCGGLFYDSLSANPLGVTIFPLLLIGLAILFNRELILKDQTFAQVVLGFGASIGVPLLTLIMLLTKGSQPLTGWGTLWQLIVMGLGGAVATPVIFELFGWLKKSLGYRRAAEMAFRPDREIRRGRRY